MLYKQGGKDSSKAENYRRASLATITCKLLEHIVHSNIFTHLNRYNLLTNAQHGFRKKRSCDAQLVSTTNDFAESLNEGEQMDTMAFGKVNHRKL